MSTTIANTKAKISARKSQKTPTLDEFHSKQLTVFDPGKYQKAITELSNKKKTPNTKNKKKEKPTTIQTELVAPEKPSESEKWLKKYGASIESVAIQLEKRKESEIKAKLEKIEERARNFYYYLLGQYNPQTALKYLDLVSSKEYLDRSPVLKDSFELSRKEIEYEEIDEDEDIAPFYY